jgi:hypothetical protein
MGQFFVKLAGLINEILPYPKRRWLALGVVVLLVGAGVVFFLAESGLLTK